MLTFTNPDTSQDSDSSQDYKLASSRTPSPPNTKAYDWIETPAFKLRAQNRLLAAEEEYLKFSNSPIVDLENRFYKSLSHLHESLDNYSSKPIANDSNLKLAWENRISQQEEIDLFLIKEHENTIMIIKELENTAQKYKEELDLTRNSLKKLESENFQLKEKISQARFSGQSTDS